MVCNRRYTERSVGYVESHDQALVGDQTLGDYSPQDVAQSHSLAVCILLT